MSAATVAAVAAVAGVASSVYGMSQQGKAQDAANAANQASVAQSNQSAWNNYLLQRGLNTGGSAATGSIPTNSAVVNAKLPLWANVTSSNGPARWVKAGTPAPATTWSMPTQTVLPQPSATPAAATFADPNVPGID